MRYTDRDNVQREISLSGPINHRAYVPEDCNFYSYATEVLQHLFEDVSNEKLKDFLEPHQLVYKEGDKHVLLYCSDGPEMSGYHYVFYSESGITGDPITHNLENGVTCWPSEFDVCVREGGGGGKCKIESKIKCLSINGDKNDGQIKIDDKMMWCVQQLGCRLIHYRRSYYCSPNVS